MSWTWFVHSVTYNTAPVVMIDIGCFIDVKITLATMTFYKVHMI